MNRREFVIAVAGLARAAQPARFVKSICSVSFPEQMPLDQCFRLAKNAGFEAVEIRLGSQVTLATGEDELQRIRDAAVKTGITISSIWPSAFLHDAPINSPDPAVRSRGTDSIRKSIGFATILGCGELLIVPGTVRWDKSRRAGYQETWERTTAALRTIVPLAERAKVILGIENLNNKFLLSPLEMRAYIDQFQSPWVQSHFDAGNGVTFSFAPDWILTLGARIHRVHLKDWKGDPHGGGGRFVPLTEGDIDWKEVMTALVKVGYRGFLSPEYGYDPQDPAQLVKISRALDKVIALV